MAGTQRQPYLLQWAILALTGAVLVVNARMASSSPPAPSGLLGRLQPARAMLDLRPMLREWFRAPLAGWLSAVGRFHH